MLADTLRHEIGLWRPLVPMGPGLAKLRALCRDRRRIPETQRATPAQFTAALGAYHPAAARLFSSVDREISLLATRGSWSQCGHSDRVLVHIQPDVIIPFITGPPPYVCGSLCCLCRQSMIYAYGLTVSLWLARFDSATEVGPTKDTCQRNEWIYRRSRPSSGIGM